MRQHRQRNKQSAWWLAAILGVSLGLGLLIAGKESDHGHRFEQPRPDGPACLLSDYGLRICPDPLVCLDQRPAPAPAPAAPDAPTIKAAGVADPVGTDLTSTAPDTGGTGLILLAFVAGYQAGGGPPELLDHLLYDVIPCESGWLIDPGNPDYRGLGQFKPGTWASYSRPGADWRDPWEQGWAVADLTGDLLDRDLSPGSSGGWPSCWW